VSVELGHFSLILAFAIATVSAIGGLMFWRRGGGLSQVLGQAAILQFVLVAVAFLALTHAFVVSDFSVALVANHSHSLKPLVFKISGVWGNHEGSLLLWILILVACSAPSSPPSAAACRTDLLPISCSATQSLLTCGLCRLHAVHLQSLRPHLIQPPLEGNDLNPVSCRISASPSIRRCSMRAMSASRSAFPSPLPR
jgi:cytochrome c-type biogenesis protein CcmF